MHVQLPLRTDYKHRSYDALATSVPLSDYEEEEMEVRGVSDSTRPDNHLKQSLFALGCFCPVGVKALSQSLIVDRLLKAGDTEGAKRASKRAKHYYTVAVKIAFVLYTILILLLAAAVIFGIFYEIDSVREFH